MPTDGRNLHQVPTGGGNVHSLPTSLRGLQDVPEVLHVQHVQLSKNLLSVWEPVSESRLQDLPAVFPGSSSMLPVPEQLFVADHCSDGLTAWLLALNKLPLAIDDCPG